MRVENSTESKTQDMNILLDALPKEGGTDQSNRQLADLITRISQKKVPASSFSRMWTLGSLQAKVALGYFAYWLRSNFANATAKERLKNEAHTAAALQLFGTMGYLRGAVMKVGQLLANLPEVVPDEFADVLSALHFEAPPMHFSMIREVFLDEFDHEPEEVFASFDRQAFAAASLGQVHRARLHSGEEVAVKIQYPGIARTIKADLRNLRILLQPMCLSKGWQNTLELLAEIESMLLLETDYVQEARFGNEIRHVFAEADQVVIPKVYDGYSTQRVLTTEYLKGCHLDEFLASSPSQERRDHFTALISAAMWRVYYALHWFTGDPHPGNFIFMNDGRLGFIDFGCSRVICDDCWHFTNLLMRHTLEGNEADLNRTIAETCFIESPGDMKADKLEAFRQWIYWETRPLLHEGVFDFGNSEHFKRGIDCFAEMARVKMRSHPIYFWSTRSVFLSMSLNYRLKGRCDSRKIFLRESAGVFSA